MGQDSQELARMENDANNPAFLSAIHSEPDNLALQQLLSHIPLLHQENNKAREEYLKLLPKVLFGSIEDSDYLYQCRQIISLALVHPAFPHEDREKLKFWLSRLEEKMPKQLLREMELLLINHTINYDP
ncbi:protein Smaug homolog 1-like [Gigantopelta aegis]|uniref:protein Smaug homolog 1-like n=1 Tax=Gigantopelta aegis TaxID=1735272 RepID=UPI001B88B1D8|nr:protein Smaug homolog 1-like [Gigantopelta aegis]